MSEANLKNETHPAGVAFLEAWANTISHELRLSFLDETAMIVDHDVPFPMDKEAYADHLAFHVEHWSNREFCVHGLQVDAFDATVVVSCFFNERGKPKNGGFRQRPGFVTATCVETDAGWKALHVHMSPLRAQILDASPG